MVCATHIRPGINENAEKVCHRFYGGVHEIMHLHCWSPAVSQPLSASQSKHRRKWQDTFRSAHSKDNKIEQVFQNVIPRKPHARLARSWVPYKLVCSIYIYISGFFDKLYVNSNFIRDPSSVRFWKISSCHCHKPWWPSQQAESVIVHIMHSRAACTLSFVVLVTMETFPHRSASRCRRS